MTSPYSNFCACMGPIGDDPMCPCAMRQTGFEPSTAWTPEKLAEFEAALIKIMERYD